MIRILHWAIAILFLVSAFAMLAYPQLWYASTPGVEETGPFNSHFVRDIGLIFLTSSGAIAFGLYRQNTTALMLGATWPCLHAAFHILIWFHRGFPIDTVALVNLVGIQLPAWTALLFSFRQNLKDSSHA